MIKAKTMSRTLQLVAYFETDGTAAHIRSDAVAGADYVAGLRDFTGEDCGLRVPLPSEVVERMVLRRAKLKVALDPDGHVLIRAEGLDDGAYDAAMRDGDLQVTKLSRLVEDCLLPEELARSEDLDVDLQALRDELARSLSCVDASLAKLRRS